MSKRALIATLSDKEAYRTERALNWTKNVAYWLSQPLRHVVDVGNYIADRAESLCQASGRSRPVVVDMGFGSAWLLEELIRRRAAVRYVGLDCTAPFVEHARKRFGDAEDSVFHVVDFEEPCDLIFEADVVVNAFNFFELSDLACPFQNAARFLRPGGTLYVATIDKSYLILALSEGWADYHQKLKAYQDLPGTKYAFQPIDLGASVSERLYYPSVLYSTEDYFDAAISHGLTLRSYKEHSFTARTVPKIYCHYEFVKLNA